MRSLWAERSTSFRLGPTASLRLNPLR
jgi:hypothetical protein